MMQYYCGSSHLYLDEHSNQDCTMLYEMLEFPLVFFLTSHATELISAYFH